MKSSRKIEVSKASLISLKAELSRKQDEVNKARVQGAYIHPVPRPKKQTVWTKENAKVTERNEKDLEQQIEDEDILKKSRAVLEAKTKLYEKLSRNSTDDDTFLVNFQQKITEEKRQEVNDECDSPSDPEEDWMDYVDCLGRTRKCLKEDLAYVKEKDSVLSKSLGNIEENLVDEKDEDVEDEMEPELLSANLKREMMRQKWEQQEEMLRNKSDIHYQDVLFDEARNHGVGYYSFSQDEIVRKAQQESLGKLRQETQKIQEATKNAQERRKQQMEARLKAARRRKRVRMGLPPEEEEKEPEVKEEPEKEEDNKVEEIKPEPKLGTTKPPKIRPWDIGKEGVKEPMSQEEWVKKKRIERPDEFAPPSSYQPDFFPVPGLQVKPKQSLFFFSKKPSVIQENEDDYERPLRLGTPSANMPSSSIGMQDRAEIYGEEIDISPPGDFDYHKRQSESNIQIDGNVRGRGAEIPPPPTFEYYQQSFITTRKNIPNANNLESAIDAGLKYLRQQSNEKQNTREKGLLGII